MIVINNSLIGIIIFKINTFPNIQTFYMHITINNYINKKSL